MGTSTITVAAIEHVCFVRVIAPFFLVGSLLGTAGMLKDSEIYFVCVSQNECLQVQELVQRSLAFRRMIEHRFSFGCSVMRLG